MNKLTIQKRPIYLAFIFFFSHAMFLLIFRNNGRVLGIGSDLFQTVAPALSASWLYTKYLKESGKDRKFWLFLSLTIFCYALAMLVLDYYEILLNIAVPFPSLADGFWMGMFVCILIAFVYLLVSNRNVIRLRQMVYDTFIVTAVAAPASWEWLLKPTFHRLVDQGIWYKIICGSYPIGNLAILIALLCVFHSVSMKFPSKVFMLIFFGTCSFLMADIWFLYLESNGQYSSGHPVDLIWALGIYLIGISPAFSMGDVILTQEKAPSDKKNRKLRLNYFLSFRLWAPYMGVFVLFLIMAVQSKWANSLVIGAITSLLLIIFRQLSTLADNDALIKESKHLNRELEYKVQQRTKQLDQKNQQLLENIQKVQYMADHDPLTTLSNRRYFEKRLSEELEKAKEKNQQLAILFLDLDRYKLINDTLGHPIGDLLLTQVAERLQISVGDAGFIGRHGGDEFLVMLPNTNREEVTRIAENILESSRKVFAVHEYELFITSSIGISLYPDHGGDSETLITRADAALHAVKKAHRNQFLFFDSSMNIGTQENLELEKDLRFALERKEFFLVYQPLVQIQTGKVGGVEALIRWQHPVKGRVSPGMFIPMTEETGLIIPLGEWVLETACRQWKKWMDEGLPQMTMAVNISTRQFLHPEFLNQTRRILRKTGMDPHYLKMEITENIPFISTNARGLLEKLRKMGIEISIDDFGTGYSSLQYLKRLPVNQLKIDQSFIRDIPNDQSDNAIVKTIIEMAHQMQLEVVAEGVESIEQLQFLKQHCCPTVQGFLFSKPLTAEDFETQFPLNSKMV